MQEIWILYVLPSVLIVLIVFKKCEKIELEANRKYCRIKQKIAFEQPGKRVFVPQDAMLRTIGLAYCYIGVEEGYVVLAVAEAE